MITVFQLAEFRGVKKEADDSITMEAFTEVGLPFFGGCQYCHATIAAYNAYPCVNGYLACEECTAADSFESVEEANLALFPEEYTVVWNGVGKK